MKYIKHNKGNILQIRWKENEYYINAIYPYSGSNVGSKFIFIPNGRLGLEKQDNTITSYILTKL